MPLAIKYILQHAQAAQQDLKALQTHKDLEPGTTHATQLNALISALSSFTGTGLSDQKDRQESSLADQAQIATLSEELRKTLLQQLKAAEVKEQADAIEAAAAVEQPGAAKVTSAPVNQPKRSDLLYNALIALAKIATVNADDRGNISCMYTGEEINEAFYTIDGYIFELSQAARNSAENPNLWGRNPYHRQFYHPRDYQKIKDKLRALGLSVQISPAEAKAAAIQSLQALQTIFQRCKQACKALIKENVLSYWDIYELYKQTCETQATNEAAIAVVIAELERRYQRRNKPLYGLWNWFSSKSGSIGILVFFTGIIVLVILPGKIALIGGIVLIGFGFIISVKATYQTCCKIANMFSNAIYTLPRSGTNGDLYNRILESCSSDCPRLFSPPPEQAALHQPQQQDEYELGVVPAIEYKQEDKPNPVSAQQLLGPVAAPVQLKTETPEERRAKLLQDRENLSAISSTDPTTSTIS